MSLVADIELDQHPVDNTDDATLRMQLQQLLKSGLEVQKEPRAYEHEQILKIVSQLQNLQPDNYKNKLATSGFTLTPYMPTADEDDAQACETCMYYKVHRKFCELPELMLPVEPEWSCVLWRI